MNPAMLLLLGCAPQVDLTGLEPLTAVAIFRFVGMAEDDRRVLAITVPDLIVDGETDYLGGEVGGCTAT